MSRAEALTSIRQISTLPMHMGCGLPQPPHRTRAYMRATFDWQKLALLHGVFWHAHIGKAITLSTTLVHEGTDNQDCYRPW